MGLARWLSALICAAVLASCSSSGPCLLNCPVGPTKYTLGGKVGGLAGSGLTLANNNVAIITIAYSGNGNYPAFSTGYVTGTAYSVTVLTQPTNPSQTCTVA